MIKMNKSTINKFINKFGLEIHGIGFMEKLRNLNPAKSAWLKQRNLVTTNNPVIFDVGANRGDTTSKYLELFPDAAIFAFEPFEPSYNIFKKIHKQNINVRLVPMGLSNEFGIAQLNVNKSIDTNSLLSSKKLGATSDYSCETIGTVNINLITIDDFCEKNRINEIDILKIDVQGSELNVLKGAKKMLSKNAIKLVYTESYFKQQYSEQPLFHEIASFLYEFGFTLQDIYDPYYNAESILWCDSIFILKQ